MPPADAGAQVRSSALQPGAVRCGAAMCTSHGIGKIVFGPCCPAAAPGRCGVDVSAGAAIAGLSAGCMELEAPGRLDVSCPALPVAAGAGFPGCRKHSGRCGVLLSLGNVDLGCVETAGFVAQSTSAHASSAVATGNAAPSASAAPVASSSPPGAPAPPKPDKPGAISHRCCDAMAQNIGGDSEPVQYVKLIRAAAVCRDLADRGVAKNKALARLRAVLDGGELPGECRKM